MYPFADAGAQNETDDGGAGSPELQSNAGASLPSVPDYGPAQPQAGPPAPANSAAIAALQQRLAQMQNPVQPQETGLHHVLRTVLPLIAASYAAGTGRGAAGYAEGFQRADEAQAAKQRATALQADQDAQAQMRVADAIRALQAQDEAQSRQRLADVRAAELKQRQDAAEADRVRKETRQRALDMNTFLSKQAENKNWVTNTLGLINQDPSQIDRLSVQSPWGDPIPMRQIVDLGYMTKNPDTGQYEVKAKKAPTEKLVHDNGQIYSVMLDPETNQVLSRTYMGEDKEKAPPTPHFTLQPEVDENGKQTGNFKGYNTLTNTWEPVKGEGPKATKAAPGAAQASREELHAQTAGADIDEALKQVDAADKAGLLGPGAGRAYGQFLAGTVGSTGDEKKDTQLGALRSAISTLKISYPGAITGGAGGRGVSLTNRLDKVLNDEHMSASLIKGALTDMRGAVARRSEKPSQNKNDVVVDGGTYVKGPDGKWVKQ